MSYSLFVHPLARLDILDAVMWYEEQRAGLGLEMSDQVDTAIGRAADNPLAFAIIEEMVRRVLCRRFPYAVFFEVDGTGWSSWRSPTSAVTPSRGVRERRQASHDLLRVVPLLSLQGRVEVVLADDGARSAVG